jgi:hypothetical protein
MMLQSSACGLVARRAVWPTGNGALSQLLGQPPARQYCNRCCPVGCMTSIECSTSSTDKPAAIFVKVAATFPAAGKQASITSPLFPSCKTAGSAVHALPAQAIGRGC